MIPGSPGGTQFAASLCRFSPCFCEARNASALACHSCVSFIGGRGGMWRLLRQSTSHSPLQSGSFASAAHFWVAGSAANAAAGFGGEPLDVWAAGRVGGAHAAVRIKVAAPSAAVKWILLIVDPLDQARVCTTGLG